MTPAELSQWNGGLRTGRLIDPARREDLITKLAPVLFDPNATCPIFDGFLDRIMGGDELLKSYIQRLVGYSLTGATQEQILCVLFGSGANGKTTFLEAIASGKSTWPISAATLAQSNLLILC